MIQLLAQGASVARLLAASTSVGSFGKYLAVIERAFKAAEVPIGASDCLRAPSEGDEPLTEAELGQLDQLFSFRNELVHEIGMSVVGHPNIRDSWGPDDAVRLGGLAVRVVRRLEGVLSRYAPKDFPNLLDENGWPRSVLDRLKSEIGELERAIDRALLSEDWAGKSGTHADWGNAVALASESVEAELAFLEHAGALHSRYIDLKTPLKLEVASARARYLRKLLVELVGEAPGRIIQPQ